MTPMKYASDLYASLCKVASVYDKSTLNEIFVEGDDSSIYCSLRKYCATHPHADVINIAFKAWWLLATQRSSVKPASSGNYAAQQNPSPDAIGISCKQMLLKQNHFLLRRVTPVTSHPIAD